MKCFFLVLFSFVKVLDENHHLFSLLKSDSEIWWLRTSYFCLSLNVIANHNVPAENCFISFLRELRGKLPWRDVIIFTNVQVFKVDCWNFFLNLLQPPDLHDLTGVELHELVLVWRAISLSFCGLVFDAVRAKRHSFPLLTSWSVSIHSENTFSWGVRSLYSCWTCPELETFVRKNRWRHFLPGGEWWALNRFTIGPSPHFFV